MAAITLNGLTKEYTGASGGDVRAVDGLDLEIADGEFFALLGPSGCGKTTLLRTIAGLETATAGRLAIGDRDVTAVPAGDRGVAMVFQDYALFPHMSVAENIAYPLRIRRVPTAERQAKAVRTAAGLSLSALLERLPGQLSGGQQQRVALARAIACHPQVFLLDEPLSNLDARLRLEARTFLKRLQRELAVTTVFVTHDQAEALAMADRIAVMEAGRIRQVGTPREVFQRPASVFVANFIGSTPMNLVEVGADSPLLAGFTAPAGLHTLGIRPEYVTLAGSQTDGGLPATVLLTENLGASCLVSVELTAAEGSDPVTLRAVVPDLAEPEPGAKVWVRPDPTRLLAYDADGNLL